MLKPVKVIVIASGLEAMIDPCIFNPNIHRLAVETFSPEQPKTTGYITEVTVAAAPVEDAIPAADTVAEEDKSRFTKKNPDEIIEIRKKLDEAGVKYDKRWGASRLQECYNNYLSSNPS